MKGELLEAERVHSIVGAFYMVYTYYGYGLGEAIYTGALEYELSDRGHEVVRDLLVPVQYRGTACRLATGWTWSWTAPDCREQGDRETLAGRS